MSRQTVRLSILTYLCALVASTPMPLVDGRDKNAEVDSVVVETGEQFRLFNDDEVDGCNEEGQAECDPWFIDNDSIDTADSSSLASFRSDDELAFPGDELPLLDNSDGTQRVINDVDRASELSFSRISEDFGETEEPPLNLLLDEHGNSLSSNIAQILQRIAYSNHLFDSREYGESYDGIERNRDNYRRGDERENFGSTSDYPESVGGFAEEYVDE